MHATDARRLRDLGKILFPSVIVFVLLFIGQDAKAQQITYQGNPAAGFTVTAVAGQLVTLTYTGPPLTNGTYGTFNISNFYNASGLTVTQATSNPACPVVPTPPNAKPCVTEPQAVGTVPSISFYVTKAQDTYWTYSQGAGGAQKNYSGYIDVVGPQITNSGSSSNITISTGSLAVTPESSDPTEFILGDGNGTAGTASGGMYAIANLPNVPGYAGTYKWVQTINSLNLTYYNMDGTTVSCPAFPTTGANYNTNAELALDTADPDFDVQQSTNSSIGNNVVYDSPNTSVSASQVKKFVMGFSATTRLFWTPSVTGTVTSSIPVEVFRFGWNFNLVANSNGKTFTIDNSNSTFPANPYITTGVGYYPVWSQVLTGEGVSGSCN